MTDSPDNTAPPPLSFGEALNLIEPAVRQARVIAALEPLIRDGASLEQARSEIEVRITDKRAELAGVEAQVTEAQRNLAFVEAKAGQAAEEALERRAAILREVASIEATRDARRAELATVEQRLADAKAATVKILAASE